MEARLILICASVIAIMLVKMVALCLERAAVIANTLGHPICVKLVRLEQDIAKITQISLQVLVHVTVRMQYFAKMVLGVKPTLAADVSVLVDGEGMTAPPAGSTRIIAFLAVFWIHPNANANATASNVRMENLTKGVSVCVTTDIPETTAQRRAQQPC